MTANPPVRPATALPPGPAPRVLIVDDQELIRAGFRLILTARGIDVAGEAADGAAAVEAERRLAPDVVLMDIRMPGMDGIEAARRILARNPHCRVLMLTTFDLDRYVYAALALGASGFLLKDVGPEQLTAGIRAVASGDALLAPAVTRRLIDEFVRTRPRRVDRPEALDALTPRELEVLGLVAQGLSNAEIADLLVVEETTVKTHVSRLLAKLDLRDRVQAVILAYDSGLIRS